MAEDAAARDIASLAAALHRDGLLCSIKYGGEGVQVFQDGDSTHCYYDVVPWRADPRVPVLYFCMYMEDSDGTVSVAGIDEVRRRLLRADMAKWVTPTEHPVTALPVLFIHPCHTRTWLADTGGDWHLWLQHFGRQVGLCV